MRFSIILGLLITCSTWVYAQNEDIPPLNDSVVTYLKTIEQNDDSFLIFCCESMPEFINGDIQMLRFIKQNMRQDSSIARKGKVYLKFIVNKQGDVTNVIIPKGLNKETNDEAIRLVNLLKFKPAMQNGKPINCYYHLPINFGINEKK